MSESPTIDRQDNGRIICTVSFTEEQRTRSEQAALQSLAADVKLDGFRPGTAPPALLKEKVDPAKLFEETVRGLLPETFTALVQEHDIKPIISPSVEIVSESPLTVKVTFVERPKVTLKGAGKLKVEKKEPEVGDKEVDQAVQYMLKQHQDSKEVDRAAQEGDRVTMDFSGRDQGGNEIDAIRTTGHQVIIGSKVLLPGFEDELKGLKKGDTREFTLTFPEKHQAEELRGKPVTFSVTVHTVEEVGTPELTDTFVKEKLGAESVTQFRGQIRDSLKAQEQQVMQRKLEEEAFDKIREATKVELLPELIEDEKRMLMEDLSRQLQQQNMSIKDWLERTGKTDEQAEKELGEQAEKRLTLRLGLSALVEERDIQVSDEEMQQSVEALLSPVSDEERQKAEPAYRKGQQAYEQLKWQKTIDKLLADIIQ